MPLGSLGSSEGILCTPAGAATTARGASLTLLGVHFPHFRDKFGAHVLLSKEAMMAAVARRSGRAPDVIKSVAYACGFRHVPALYSTSRHGASVYGQVQKRCGNRLCRQGNF